MIRERHFKGRSPERVWTRHFITKSLECTKTITLKPTPWLQEEEPLNQSFEEELKQTYQDQMNRSFEFDELSPLDFKEPERERSPEYNDPSSAKRNRRDHERPRRREPNVARSTYGQRGLGLPPEIRPRPGHEFRPKLEESKDLVYRVK